MGLRDIGSTLPPGFRFYPSDEELVCHYLYKKIANEDVLKGTLVEIDLHTCEPWQLPEAAKLNSNEYYFFSFRDRKYATGYRTNRATTSGYWKATGKDRTVLDPKSRATVGMRKTLVFYKNRAPNGIKTGWIMHEFRLENPHIPPKEDWVLCRVFYKAKGENSNESMYDNTIDHATSPNMDISPPLTADCQPLPCGGYHHQITTTTTSSSFSHQSPSLHHHNQNFLGLPSQCNHPNFLQLPRETMLKETMVDQTTLCSNNNKCEDQYGFFFDMGFEDDMPSHLHDLGFEDDVNDDGMVFFE